MALPLITTCACLVAARKASVHVVPWHWLQGRFASAVTPIIRPSPRPRPSAQSAEAQSTHSSATETTAEAVGGMRGPASRPTATDHEDKAAVLKRLAAERFRQFMQSNAQRQSSFYDELPPPVADKDGGTSASHPPPS